MASVPPSSAARSRIDTSPRRRALTARPCGSKPAPVVLDLERDRLAVAVEAHVTTRVAVGVADRRW